MIFLIEVLEYKQQEKNQTKLTYLIKNLNHIYIYFVSLFFAYIRDRIEYIKRYISTIELFEKFNPLMEWEEVA